MFFTENVIAQDECFIDSVQQKMVRVGISTDSRIGNKFLFPGLGYGGSCFPKDVNALINTSKKAGYEPKLLQKVEQVNQAQKLLIVKKIVLSFFTLKFAINESLAPL